MVIKFSASRHRDKFFSLFAIQIKLLHGDLSASRPCKQFFTLVFIGVKGLYEN